MRSVERSVRKYGCFFFVSIWYCNAVFCLKDEVLVKTITEKVDELKCKEDSGACQNAKSGDHKDINLPISLDEA